MFLVGSIVHFISMHVLQTEFGNNAKQDLQTTRFVTAKRMCKKRVFMHVSLRSNETQIVHLVKKFETDLQQVNSKVEEIRSELFSLKEDFQAELSNVNRSCLYA